MYKVNSNGIHNKEKVSHYFKKYGIALLFLIPFFTFFVIFFIYPLINGITMSFYHYNMVDPSDTYFVGFKNYFDFLFVKEKPIIIEGEPIYNVDGTIMTEKNPSFYGFWYGLLYTVLYCLVIVPVSIILPFFLALGIKKKPYGFKIFRSLIYLPSIFAVSSTGAAFAFLFQNGENGFINHLFGINYQWFNNRFSAWFVIFLLCLYNIGGNFVIIAAGLENVNKSLYEAAEVDGSTTWDKIRYVTIPGIKYQLIICTFNTIIGYMNVYGQMRVLTGGGPADPQHSERPGLTHSIVYVIQDKLTGAGKFSTAGSISAMCIILGIIIGLITTVQLIVTRDKKGGDKYEKKFIQYFQGNSL